MKLFWWISVATSCYDVTNSRKLTMLLTFLLCALFASGSGPSITGWNFARLICCCPRSFLAQSSSHLSGVGAGGLKGAYIIASTV